MSARSSDHRVRVLVTLWRLSEGGGVPVVVRAILKHFDRSRFEMHVCTIRPYFDEDRSGELEEGVQFHPLNLRGKARASLQGRALFGTARTAAAVRPDVLHLHGGTAVYSSLAALLQRSRGKILDVHDAPQSGRMSHTSRAVERWMARRLGFTPLAHSTAVREATAEAWQLDPESVALVPLGVDVERFAPSASRGVAKRKALGIPPETSLVTYIARIAPEKRPELFLQVAERVLEERDNVRFALVGGGAALGETRRRVERLGLQERVLVPGFVDDLADFYHASDLFLSTSRYEGFGLAIAEAMAAGVPAVSTDVGGVRDVIGDAGILEPADDPDRLAGHVISLLDDTERLERLGRASRDRAISRLDIRSTVRGFEELYRRVSGSDR